MPKIFVVEDEAGDFAERAVAFPVEPSRLRDT